MRSVSGSASGGSSRSSGGGGSGRGSFRRGCSGGRVVLLCGMRARVVCGMRSVCAAGRRRRCLLRRAVVLGRESVYRPLKSVFLVKLGKVKGNATVIGNVSLARRGDV